MPRPEAASVAYVDAIIVALLLDCQKISHRNAFIRTFARWRTFEPRNRWQALSPVTQRLKRQPAVQGLDVHCILLLTLRTCERYV